MSRRTPPALRPMLATLGPVPVGEEWAFEFKWDGVRALVTVLDGEPRAVSRNDLEITAGYPELAALPALPDVVLDGELVTLDPSGATSFSLLQQRMHVRNPSAAMLAKYPVLFYAFDLLWLDGRLLTGEPYSQRRSLLESLPASSPLVIPPSFPGPGQALLEAAAEHGIEGIVAKRVGSAYQSGRRTPDWIKVPRNLTQEVIIIGWKAGEGRRAGTIGSLLLGAYAETGELHYIGHVGTGFTGAMLDDLAARLAPLHRPDPPVTGKPVPREFARHAQWTEPTLVGEVEFRTWTPDGRMRHPSWRGLRADKSPADVTLQNPQWMA